MDKWIVILSVQGLLEDHIISFFVNTFKLGEIVPCLNKEIIMLRKKNGEMDAPSRKLKLIII